MRDVTEGAKSSFPRSGAVTGFVTTAGHFQKPREIGHPDKLLRKQALASLQVSVGFPKLDYESAALTD